MGWLMILASVVIMYKVAQMERRSGIIWGGITLALCLLSAMFIHLPLINIAIGLALSYFLMFLSNLAGK